MAVMSVAVKMMNPMSIIVKIWWLKFTCLCCVCVVEDVRSCDKQIKGPFGSKFLEGRGGEGIF
jgi:hypothetical protein